MDNREDGERRNVRPDHPERGSEQRFVSALETTLDAHLAMGQPMTPERAYEMGYRHITDLAEMNRIAAMVEIERLNAFAVKLMEAWREGAMAAKAMLEKQTSTLQ